MFIVGDAEDLLGYKMRGGVLGVAGNVGRDVGDRMGGGMILLNGGYESLGEDMVGGDILKNCKYLVKNGEVLV